MQAYNHWHALLWEGETHLLITLPVCLAHSCPTPQVRLLVGPKTGHTAKSTQFTSQSGVCLTQYKSAGFIFINSQKPDTQTRKCSCIHPLFLYPHTHSHSIQVQYHCTNFLERSDSEWFYTDLDINKDLVHKIYSISYMYKSL